MSNQNGITLVSIAIYIMLILITLGILSTVITNFQSGIKDDSREGTNIIEVNKFNLFFLQEIKTKNIELVNIFLDGDEANTGNEIKFSNNKTFIFDSNNKVIKFIERNNSNEIIRDINIATDIENCTFSSNTENDKTIIIVTIKPKDIGLITQEFVLNDEQELNNYENEENYV